MALKIENSYDILSEEEIKHIIYTSKALAANDWRILESIMNRLQNNIFEEIRNKYTLLTEDDIHIILLLRIGFSHKEISRLCDILPASLRKRRYRLKKKMDVECNSITDFIKNLYMKKETECNVL